MKTQKGFTLVEVIVVAVIVAILGAGAILLYRGWVLEARQDAVEQIAQTAAAAANAYYRKTGSHPPDQNVLNLFIVDATRYTITISSGTTPPTVDVSDNKYSVSASASY